MHADLYPAEGKVMHVSLRRLALAMALLIPPCACGDGSPAAPNALPPACDSTLWDHVYDPARLEIHDSCRTVSGTVASQHANGDGDVDSELAPDPMDSALLNDVNRSKLRGHLQIEEICQASISRDAFHACRGYTGTVLVPPVGSHVRVTGSYVRDKNHGWMEIHPVSAVAVIP
jgi:hypothetical protein